MNCQNLYLPRCAVLLAVYNGKKYIDEQVQSIIKQKNVSTTIFVSVDVSTDNSFNILQSIALHNANVIILPYGEKFGGAARNFFRLIHDVDINSYDYIAFADQDDIWFPDKLSKAISRLKTSKYDGYSSNVIAFWPNNKKRLIRKSQHQKKWDFLFEAAGPGCTYVISKNLMLAIKSRMITSWDDLQKVDLHDWFCYAFARANGYSWYIDNEPSMLYRQHNHNQVGVNRGLKAYISRIKSIKSGRWLNQVLLITKLIGLSEHKFISKWSSLNRFGILRLAKNFTQTRRRLKEQMFFLFICVVLVIIGCPNNNKNESSK